MKKLDYRKLTTTFKQFMVENINEYTMFLYKDDAKYKFGNASLVSSFVGEYGFAITVSAFKITKVKTELKDNDKVELFFNIIHTDDAISNIKLTIISDDVTNAEQLKQDMLMGTQERDLYNLGNWLTTQILPIIKQKLKTSNKVFHTGIRTDFVHLDVDGSERVRLLMHLGEFVTKAWLSKHIFKSATVQGK